MAGVDYVVRTIYTAVDQGAHAAAGRMATAHDKAAASTVKLGAVAESAKSAIDGLASKMLMLGAVGVGAVGAGALAAMKTGIVDVNSKLEETTIGFATIFRMLGASDTFEGGLGAAKKLMAEIRQDAASLPGEFQDFVSMAQTLSAPLINAGKGLEDIRNLTKQTVVAAAAMGVEYGQAAREMAELVEGRAGTHNVLGMRMGITTHTQIAGGKEFNKATADERIAYLQKVLKTADESLPAFQRSWSGLTSTLTDNVKALLGRTTAPVFERAKQELVRINKLFDAAGPGVFADKVGKALVAGFDHAVSAVEWIVSHWKQIEYGAIRFGEHLHAALEKAWPIAQKIAGVLAEHGGGMALGLGAARVGLGVATSPVGSALAGAAGAVSGAAVAGVMGALVAAAGAFDLITAKAGELPGVLDTWSTMAKQMWNQVEAQFGETWNNIKGIASDLFEAARPLVDLFGLFLVGALDTLVHVASALSAALKAFTGWIRDQLAKVGLATADEDAGATEDFELDPVRAKAMLKLREKGFLEDRDKLQADVLAKDKANAEALAQTLKKGHAMAGGGKATVTVNAPLTVLSDADPERLALRVATHIDKELRNAKSALSLAGFRHE